MQRLQSWAQTTSPPVPYLREGVSTTREVSLKYKLLKCHLREPCGVPSHQDIHTPPGHVCGYGDNPRHAGLRDDLCLSPDVLWPSIQHLMGHLPAAEALLLENGTRQPLADLYCLLVDALLG